MNITRNEFYKPPVDTSDRTLPICESVVGEDDDEGYGVNPTIFKEKPFEIKRPDSSREDRLAPTTRPTIPKLNLRPSISEQSVQNYPRTAGPMFYKDRGGSFHIKNSGLASDRRLELAPGRSSQAAQREDIEVG